MLAVALDSAQRARLNGCRHATANATVWACGFGLLRRFGLLLCFCPSHNYSSGLT
nr:hypothetical protein [Halomonas sp.]